MKTLITFILSACIISLVSAQVEVREQSMESSLGHQNAFAMDHRGADQKMVTKIFEKAFKEYGKVKKNKKAKEYNCLQCSVPGFSNPVNVYFKITKGKGTASSYVFYDDGTQFVSSENSPEEAQRIINDLTYIGHDVSRAVIKKELEAEEDNLKDRNKEQEKLEKKNKNLHEDIEEYKKKIAEAEKAIEKNLQEQEDKKMEIEKQARVIEQVTDKLNNVGKG